MDAFLNILAKGILTIQIDQVYNIFHTPPGGVGYEKKVSNEK